MGNETIDAIAEYQNDVDVSLRLYFREVSTEFSARFPGRRVDEVRFAWDQLLATRLEETDQRSAFFVLTGLERAFRTDYDCRCKKRLKDDLSRVFRATRKYRKARVRLDEDIFEAWREKRPDLRRLIGELRSAFRFRNHLAHGRYGEPGRIYDFVSVYDLAVGVLNAFQLQDID
ncbi:MAG: hypothetical protein WBM11_09655 [Terriglobales bacterium]